MWRKLTSFLSIFMIVITLVGCSESLNPASIIGYEEGEEYISMWVHTIENTPEGEAYKKSVQLFNEKYNGKYFLDVEFIPRNQSGGGYREQN